MNRNRNGISIFPLPFTHFPIELFFAKVSLMGLKGNLVSILSTTGVLHSRFSPHSPNPGTQGSLSP